MPTTKIFDVFLSHHSSDKKWVINLKNVLETHGINVWLDKDEIRPGDLFAKALEDGLKSSKNIVFVVTKKSMKSKWVEEEYYRALGLSKSKKQPARLIPIVLQTAKLPGFLESRNWVDFRNEEEFDENVEKLVWGITGQDKYKEAKQRYIELALKAYDIIDLGNLPDQDFRVATERIYLRNLYVSLKVKPEIGADTETREIELEAIEKRRKASRNDKGMFGLRDDNFSKRLEQEAVPIGIRLNNSRQLVILGDPGAGKTTLVKWIATACLLRTKGDKDWRKLPDIETLPKEELFPIIVRCRELPKSCLDGTLDDILSHTLQKLELDVAKCKLLLTEIHEKLHKGQILLLIDGLDEITDSGLRICFCKQIERIHDANPSIPIIVTSRIVGYKEMGDRILRGFELFTIADLSKEDKELFAQRWYEVTEASESLERRESHSKGLIEAINSNNRLQQLTSNPMMLTTLALVKRKVGKLPSRRVRLYWEAVQVLLNWRHEVDTPIDDHEAMPQLEYLAYSMCENGIQQIREDEIFNLFDNIRKEYPNIHAVQQHSSADFLQLLIRRTGILIKTGFVRHHGIEIPIYEFKHLTFQEYLAGLGLVRGHFPGYSQSKSLAEYVAPLVGRIAQEENDESREQDNWREAVRLCVASCNDTDVDSVLMGILSVQKGEDSYSMARLRAIEATLCLADDVNASETVARSILVEFAKQINKDDGNGRVRTDIDAAAIEMAQAKPYWLKMMRLVLVEEFCRRDTTTRQEVGGLCGMMVAKEAPVEGSEFLKWSETKAAQLMQVSNAESIEVALGVMQLAYERKARVVPGLIEGLLKMVESNNPAAEHAASWALGWLNHQNLQGDAWRPSLTENKRLITAVSNPSFDSTSIRYLSWIFGNSRERDPQALEPLVLRLDEKIIDVQEAIIIALGKIGDTRAIPHLIKKLNNSPRKIRQTIVEALGEIGDRSSVETLANSLVNDSDNKVRESAAEALGKIGIFEITDALAKGVTDRNNDVRRVCVRTLGQTLVNLNTIQTPERIVQILVDRLEDFDNDVRVTAAEALGQAFKQVMDSKIRIYVIEQLIKRIKDHDALVRVEIVETLGKLKHPLSVEPLLSAVNDINNAVRDAAVLALGHIGDIRAVMPLIELIDNHALSQNATWALGKIGDMRALPHLTKLLTNPDSYMRFLAINALGMIKHVQSIDSIVKMFDDGDASIRRAALEAYLKIVKDINKISRKLLSRNINGSSPFLDIREEITEERVNESAEELDMSVDDIRLKYEELARRLPLKLVWKQTVVQTTKNKKVL